MTMPLQIRTMQTGRISFWFSKI